MLILKTTTSFRKDYKRMKKQGRDMSLLQKVIEKLLAENVLDKKYRDHALTGKYVGLRECHIQPDFLLVYEIREKEIVLYVVGVGSHSHIFG